MVSPPYITSMIPITVSNSGIPMDYSLGGMFADVFFNLQEILNFTFQVTQPPDGEWGAILGESQGWSGMIGMLQNKEIDMAIADFTVTKERSSVVSFAEPIAQIYHSLFIKNPSGTPHYGAFVEPLHWMVWLTLILFIVMTPPLLCLTV
ncbi:hypothetical protein TCAL_06562, partial [Tigriopus californicus]